MILANSEISLINPYVEYAGSYAFSPDGAYLAYMEYDHNFGEARLIMEDLTVRHRTTLGTLPIPKGSGSAIPETANLNWSADGKSLVFDFGRNAVDRAVYLANIDGTGLIKVVDTAYAPSISADGKCLSYISDSQIFLLDLRTVSSAQTAADPILLADLPAGRGASNTKQDKLQWRPGTTP
jgi:Tol biopolymer transport system component